LAEALPCHQKSGAFILQPFVIVHQSHNLFGLLPNIQALITILFDVLEVPQSLDAVDVLATLLCYLLTSAFDQIIKEHQALVNVSPVLSVIVEPKSKW
jgi:hypothetical protein